MAIDNNEFKNEVGYDENSEFDEKMLEEIFPDEEKEEDVKDDDAPKEKKNFVSDVFDWVEIIAVSAVSVLILFTFFVRLAVVDGPSMEKTLHNGDMLVISNVMYTPENNDIIVFSAPSYSHEPIVKRVIAVAGQTVDIDYENWQVTVDGQPIDEPYVNFEAGVPMLKYEDEPDFPLTVPEGYVFVLGDNRNHSIDGRSERIGLVDIRCILGNVKFRLFPFDKIGKVE